MTLHEFEQLDYNGRIKTTRRGIYLSSRDQENFTMLLYQLDGFYIEVFYNKAFNYVSSLNAFDDMDRLDPYLEEMEIGLTC